MAAKQRTCWFALLLCFFPAWISYILVSIAREPELGAGSKEELAARYQRSLTAGKAADLTNLVDYPGSGEDFTKALFDQFKELGVTGPSVKPSATPSGTPHLKSAADGLMARPSPT
jgi:hypothetical protein